MISDSDNHRPLPPAKVRRATSINTKPEVHSTPPPAYGSTFVFPSRNAPSSDFGPDILNTPIEATRRLMAAWDNESPSSNFGEESLHPEDMEWMNEKSREEMHELLLKAHGLIKDREQELGFATNIVKSVYDHNVALKSKHEALLAKIPMSPLLSHSPSPDPMSKSTYLSHSVSESNLPDPFKSRARKISIAMEDISLLADQNTELLGKLQKLEEDSTAADVAGRRELKRLEKEIAYLRDALEKTQAKSEELEGKVQNAVASEAVRRKKEREAIRDAARNNKSEVAVLDFAPPGSKFGGPSERCSLLDLPKEECHIRNDNESSPTGSDPDSLDEVVPDPILITRLLNKVKELEETNSRILRQQSETASQLAHVQQDAMNMNKVYELLSDHDSVQLELEEDAATDKLPISEERYEVPTIRFRSLRRNMEDTISRNGSFVFPEHIHGIKPRKTVLGLFDEQGPVPKNEGKAFRPSAELQGEASWPSSLSSVTSLSAGPLSPLRFFSPVLPSDSQGQTLQNELESKLGQGTWNFSGASHMRTTSLSNLSQFSAPPTPSPASGWSNRMLPDEREARTLTIAESDSVLTQTPHFSGQDTLRLSVEPPTPENDKGPAAQKRTSRLQNMSRTLRSRKARWIERTSSDILASSLNRKGTGLGLPSNAIDDNFPSDNPEEDNRNDSDFSSQMATPQAQRGELDDDEDAQTIVSKRDEDHHHMSNKSYLFQAWLWFQFVIVVLIFIFAMARKGPAVVLGHGGAGGAERVGNRGRRAVARR